MPVGVTSASGCRCGCDSEFVRYVWSIADASVIEIGVDETCRLGGGASRDDMFAIIVGAWVGA